MVWSRAGRHSGLLKGRERFPIIYGPQSLAASRPGLGDRVSMCRSLHPARTADRAGSPLDCRRNLSIPPMNLNSIRRAARARGLTPATLVPEASSGRIEEASIRPARLVEGANLEVISVGPAETCPGPLAYLDGVQRSEIVAYAGNAPIVVASVAAAVRRREERKLHTAVEAHRTVALGRPAAAAALATSRRSPCRTTSPCIRFAIWSTPVMPWIGRGALSRSSSVTATAPPPMDGSCWTVRWP